MFVIRFGLLGCGRIAKRHSELSGGNHIADTLKSAGYRKDSEFKYHSSLHPRLRELTKNCSFALRQDRPVDVLFVGGLFTPSQAASGGSGSGSEIGRRI
jgi:hypothetical protein